MYRYTYTKQSCWHYFLKMIFINLIFVNKEWVEMLEKQKK